MANTLSFQEWVNKVAIDKWLDLDGAPQNQPAQCHDIWLSYLRDVLGGTISDGNAPGGTNGETHLVWVHFGSHSPNLIKLLEKHSGSAGIRRGDVVFWDDYDGYTHVAVATETAVGGYANCVTQNPYAAAVRRLRVANAIGYLRPIKKISGIDTPDAPIQETDPEEELMKTVGIYYKTGNTYHVALMNTNSGFFGEYTETSYDYNNEIAQKLQLGSFAAVSASHYNALKRNCREVREGITIP